MYVLILIKTYYEATFKGYYNLVHEEQNILFQNLSDYEFVMQLKYEYSRFRNLERVFILMSFNVINFCVTFYWGDTETFC